jgi:hypothetical protein
LCAGLFVECLVAEDVAADDLSPAARLVDFAAVERFFCEEGFFFEDVFAALVPKKL